MVKVKQYGQGQAQELCESRGGHPGLPSLISLRGGGRGRKEGRESSTDVVRRSYLPLIKRVMKGNPKSSPRKLRHLPGSRAQQTNTGATGTCFICVCQLAQSSQPPTRHYSVLHLLYYLGSGYRSASAGRLAGFSVSL